MLNGLQKALHMLFLGPEDSLHDLSRQGYRRAKDLVKEEWTKSTYGIVRLVRLFLITLAAASPILIIDEIVNSRKPSVLALSRELYYFSRTLFLGFVLFSQLYRSRWTVAIVIFLVCDIVVHLAGGVFVWGKHSIDPTRSLLLSVLNYFELTLAFSIFYLHTGSLAWTHSPDATEALYFSLVTSTTVGFGDVHPANLCGQEIVIAQLIIFVVFIALFITTFLSRIPIEVRQPSKARSDEQTEPSQKAKAPSSRSGL
ncbi:MAG: potassium channel family protein [Candidatus Sulfotelmatobacter sp.]